MIIFKYPLKMEEIQSVFIPENAKILCVQAQHDVPCIWALVDETERSIERKFQIVGTGDSKANLVNLDYIDTFQVNGGDYIFHVFEIK